MRTARTSRTLEKGDWRAVFIATLADTGNVSAAAQAAGVGRRTVYEHYDKEPDLKAAWDEAVDVAADGMEEEAHRRAVKGTLRPVYQGGKKVGSIREYSDTLLIFMLKGARPEKYRERSDIKHSGHIDVSRLSDDELRAIVEG